MQFVVFEKSVYLITEVFLTVMTGDRHGELAALDLSMTPSWLVRVSTVMPVWLYFSSFLFCSVFFFFFWTRNYIHFKSVSCVWLLLSYRSLKSNWVWKPSKLGLHFVYSLRIFVSAHFIIRRLACLQTLFGSFIAICRLACSGFSLSIKEKKLVESPGESRTQYNLQMRWQL